MAEENENEHGGSREGAGLTPWRNSVLYQPEEELIEIRFQDSYENARVIAMTIAMDETKHDQQRMSALKFLYPEEKPELGAITAKTIVFQRVENSDVTDSTDHETETT